ncbi:AAA ATPase domain-containing protein [Chitinophaga sp. YR627]|uniref:AAA family ATPase n=1 Tax=Chitinophaga sp. YR627 TaxID=1881041 RepID=UPI0008E70D51|nr:ATP-binding protein [Chitinophaga sp. YR627]SFO76509.1 AAA ATPase domain-containing protein [Chitinophaga sp. YR627]
MEKNQTTADILARYAQKRKEKEAGSPKQEHNPQLQSYLQAAAVLHCFEPETLLPINSQYVHPQVRVLLYDYITHVAGGLGSGSFALKMPVRQQTLKELGTKAAMAEVLKANPKRTITDLQQTFETYVNSPEPDYEIADMKYQELTLLCQLVTWLDGLDPQLPPLSDLLPLLEKKSVLAGFEHLVDNNFMGRQDELQQLREFIHISDKKRTLAGKILKDLLVNNPEAGRKPILSVCGPGGIGKSALLARLLMENSVGKKAQRIPFAYLAFDQPTLRIEAPFTILLEAISQLELQLPDHKAHFDDFRDQVRNFRDDQGNIKSRGLSFDTRAGRINVSLGINQSLYQNFGALLQELQTDFNQAVVLVLDTFEEVEYRDKESLSGFWTMLQEIHQVYPLFSVIIAGRTSVRDMRGDTGFVEEIHLEHLKPADSIQLLKNLGIEAATAATVVEHIGGNPLSLRLAANLITSMKASGEKLAFDDFTYNSALTFELNEQLIQGQLYNRILNHIHDENVRKLAHPGMALRVISPEIILAVLAPICDLPVSNLDEAMQLFEDLKREHALVRIGPEDTLIYRPEIRQAMIKLLQQDKFDQLRELHRQAIFYYSNKQYPDQQKIVAGRAEEMYHRLALGEDLPDDLRTRWMDGIESSVVQNLQEYSATMQAWLASVISLEVSRDVYAHASLLEWENNITRKVQKALAQYNIDEALQLLHERPDRSATSPLYALEAKALLIREDLEEADWILQQGITKISGEANPGRLAELFWLYAQVWLLKGNYTSPIVALEMAGKAASKLASPIAQMQILCHLLKITTDNNGTAAQIRDLRTRLNNAAKKLTILYNHQDAFVIRMAKFYLQEEFPDTYDMLDMFEPDTQEVWNDMLTNENIRGLDESRGNWEQGDQFETFEALA